MMSPRLIVVGGIRRMRGGWVRHFCQPGIEDGHAGKALVVFAGGFRAASRSEVSMF